jgi:hypothetical protein
MAKLRDESSLGSGEKLDRFTLTRREGVDSASSSGCQEALDRSGLLSFRAASRRPESCSRPPTVAIRG